MTPRTGDVNLLVGGFAAARPGQHRNQPLARLDEDQSVRESERHLPAGAVVLDVEDLALALDQALEHVRELAGQVEKRSRTFFFQASRSPTRGAADAA